MYIQLRSIYNALYSTENDQSPLLCTVRKEHNLEDNAFSCFYHPSMIRWAAPALRGKVKVVYSDEEAERLQRGLELQRHVCSHMDFVRLHFHLVYEQIRYEFEQGKHATKKDNLKDFMRGPFPRFKGSGSTIRDKLLEWFSDPSRIREFVITQWLILDHYEYRPDIFRSNLVGIIDDAIEGANEDSSSSGYKDMMQNTSLLNLRNLVLELLSNGNDATALACMLLAAALGERAGPIVWQFEKKLFSDCLQLIEDAELRRIKLSEDYYLTYLESSNFLGGRRKADITLWKYPETMIEKINDHLGYFFYPVEIENPGNLGIVPSEAGECVKYITHIGTLEDGKALFQWMYQPDGRYFEDEDGFGGKNCEEIMLYSYLNEKGRFVTPFSLTVSYSK